MRPYRVLTKAKERGNLHWYKNGNQITVELVPCGLGSKNSYDDCFSKNAIFSFTATSREKALNKLDQKLLSIARKVVKYKTNEALEKYITKLGFYLNHTYLIGYFGFGGRWHSKMGFKNIRQVAQRMLDCE